MIGPLRPKRTREERSAARAHLTPDRSGPHLPAPPSGGPSAASRNVCPVAVEQTRCRRARILLGNGANVACRGTSCST